MNDFESTQNRRLILNLQTLQVQLTVDSFAEPNLARRQESGSVSLSRGILGCLARFCYAKEKSREICGSLPLRSWKQPYLAECLSL